MLGYVTCQLTRSAVKFDRKDRDSVESFHEFKGFEGGGGRSA